MQIFHPTKKQFTSGRYYLRIMDLNIHILLGIHVSNCSFIGLLMFVQLLLQQVCYYFITQFPKSWSTYNQCLFSLHPPVASEKSMVLLKQRLKSSVMIMNKNITKTRNCKHCIEVNCLHLKFKCFILFMYLIKTYSLQSANLN